MAGLAWPEVAERAAGSVVAVPLGSTEQHGPHLPLSTDTDIAVELCRRLAARRGDVLAAPAVAYGSSGEHAGFPGTLSIGAAALETVLVELGRSADAFAGILFVSGHGGNAAAVQRATRLLVSEGRNARHWFLPEVDLAGSQPGNSQPGSGQPLADQPGSGSSSRRRPATGLTGRGSSGRGEPATGQPAGDSSAGRWDAHAGYVETSVMAHLRPDAVRHDAATAGAVAALSELMPAMREGGVIAVSTNGVLGDPAGASAGAGAAILDAWAAQLVADLQGWPG